MRGGRAGAHGPVAMSHSAFPLPSMHAEKRASHSELQKWIYPLHPRKRALYSRSQKWMTPRGVWPCRIQIGPFGVNETYFCKIDFHFINWPHAAFPFPAYSEMDTPQCTTKENNTKGYMTLAVRIGPFAVNRTYFSKVNFHFINWPHAASPFSCIQWKGHPRIDPKSEWDQGMYDLGAFKLDHVQSTKPIFAK